MVVINRQAPKGESGDNTEPSTDYLRRVIRPLGHAVWIYNNYSSKDKNHHQTARTSEELSTWET
jgi:hypothetical protein